MLARRAKPVTHTVTIDATSYTPARLAVHVGDTVVWVNKDLIPHTATAKGGGFDSKALAAGASFRFTVKAKGADRLRLPLPSDHDRPDRRRMTSRFGRRAP